VSQGRTENLTEKRTAKDRMKNGDRLNTSQLTQQSLHPVRYLPAVTVHCPLQPAHCQLRQISQSDSGSKSDSRAAIPVTHAFVPPTQLQWHFLTGGYIALRSMRLHVSDCVRPHHPSDIASTHVLASAFALRLVSNFVLCGRSPQSAHAVHKLRHSKRCVQHAPQPETA
jgi:hypothetical protein